MPYREGVTHDKSWNNVFRMKDMLDLRGLRVMFLLRTLDGV